MTVVTIRVCGNTFHSLDVKRSNSDLAAGVAEEGELRKEYHLTMNVPSACSSASNPKGIDK